MLMDLIPRLWVVPLWLSPSCVRRKKSARKSGLVKSWRQEACKRKDYRLSQRVWRFTAKWFFGVNCHIFVVGVIPGHKQRLHRFIPRMLSVTTLFASYSIYLVPFLSLPPPTLSPLLLFPSSGYLSHPLPLPPTLSPSCSFPPPSTSSALSPSYSISLFDTSFSWSLPLSLPPSSHFSPSHSLPLPLFPLLFFPSSHYLSYHDPLPPHPTFSPSHSPAPAWSCGYHFSLCIALFFTTFS